MKKRRIILRILIIGLFFMGGVLVWHNYMTQGGITEKKILSKTKIGEVTRLQDIDELDYQIVCTLGPYQKSVAGDNPYKDKINKYLSSKQSSISDESYWALVFVDDFRITTININRRNDIISKGDSRLKAIELPANFKLCDWAEAKEAALYRLSIDGRNYFIFGGLVNDF